VSSAPKHLGAKVGMKFYSKGHAAKAVGGEALLILKARLR
jgi:hypothetical protein